KATIGKLAVMNANIMGRAADFDPFYGAPTVLLVLADRQYRTWHEDGNLVMGNLLNAAHAVGVDSCYIYRAREEFEREEGKALLKKWGVVGDFVGIGHCALGYAAAGGINGASPRKDNYVIYV
ncbi:MAG: nitroreductase family protein, partial [Victivallaceae bacterium]